MPFTLLMMAARRRIAVPRRDASRQPASSVMFLVSHTRGHSLPENTQQLQSMQKSFSNRGFVGHGVEYSRFRIYIW